MISTIRNGVDTQQPLDTIADQPGLGASRSARRTAGSAALTTARAYRASPGAGTHEGSRREAFVVDARERSAVLDVITNGVPVTVSAVTQND